MSEVRDARRSYCRSPEDCLMADYDGGRCPVCQVEAIAKRVMRRRAKVFRNPRAYRRAGGEPVTANTVPTYVDADFDDMGN